LRRWPIKMVRVIACLNLLFVVIGVCLLVVTWDHADRNHVPLQGPTYVVEVSKIRLVIDVVFLLALAFASIALWRLDRRAVAFCSIVFGCEVLYFLADPAIALFLSMGKAGMATGIGQSIAATYGTGNMDLTPQLLTGYPILALIFLNIASRRLHQPAEKPSEI